MIEQGLRESEIANKPNPSKQSVSYYLTKLKKCGYIRENRRDLFKLLDITQAGKNFLATYQQHHNSATYQQHHHSSAISTPICRAENIRFKAPVYKMPPSPVEWHKVEMHNWNHYTMEVDSIKIKLNDGKDATIEFIPAPINGDDPSNLQTYFIMQ